MLGMFRLCAYSTQSVQFSRYTEFTSFARNILKSAYIKLVILVSTALISLCVRGFQGFVDTVFIRLQMQFIFLDNVSNFESFNILSLYKDTFNLC